MNRKSTLFFFLLLFCKSSYGIDLLLPSSAVQNASNGLVLIADSPSSTHYHPACINQGIETGISYLFNMSELPVYTLHTAYLMDRTGVYFGLYYLANDAYKETQLNLSVNHRFNSVSIGSSLRYINNNVSRYNNDNLFLADIGLMWEQNRLRNVFTVKNVSHSRLNKSLLPVIVIYEINYTLNEVYSISVGFEKEREYDFAFKIATSYALNENISLISSYQHQPARIGAGFVCSMLRSVNVGYSFLTHQYLPLTHYFAVGYEVF